MLLAARTGQRAGCYLAGAVTHERGGQGVQVRKSYCQNYPPRGGPDPTSFVKVQLRSPGCRAFDLSIPGGRGRLSMLTFAYPHVIPASDNTGGHG